jgi:signal transduction histidine kinase
MKNFITTLTLFFSVLFAAIGQSIDSLENVLDNPKLSTIDRVKTLNLLARDLTYVKPAKSLILANEAIKLSSELNYTAGLAYAYRNLSSVYSYNEIYFLSMKYLQESLDIFKSTGDSVGIANCYISLGHMYRNLKQRKEEVEYHKKAFELFSRFKQPDRIGVTSHNLGESYFNIGDLEKCRLLTLYAIRINDSIRNLPVLTSCYKAMGILEYSLKNYPQAEEHFNKALLLSAKLGANSQKTATVESMIHLAAISKERGDVESQVQFLKSAALFSQEHSMANHLKRIYSELILFYTGRNEQHMAKKYIQEFNTVSELINTRQTKDRSELINSVIAVHNLELEKIKFEENSLRQEESIHRRNILLEVAIAFSLILVLLLLAIYRANKKLKAFNRLLENQRVTIETQKQHLQELNNTKDKFFSIIAHDLKSPLNSLKSFSTLLTDHIEYISKEEITQVSKKLSASVDNTIKMADNLLEWARVQMNEYEFRAENFSVAEVVADIYSVYKDVAEKKQIFLTCSVEDGLTAYGDKHQLTFVIRNLVNNAIKFTYSGGTVHVAASCTPSSEVLIAVSDTGVGIPEEIRNELFSTARKQSNNGTSGEKGTGLGLMLSHEFIQLNQGTIEIESEAGKGSTFLIKLKSNALSAISVS